MGFTKLDAGIVDSSIWSQAYATRVVWVTFLAKSNRQGVVKASRSGMVRASNVKPDEFTEAERVLSSPDEDSRSPEHDGRRIQKIDGGWIILNYKKYRDYSYSDSPEAIRQRRHRGKEQDAAAVTGCDTSRSGRDISASASASVKEEKSAEEGRKIEFRRGTASWSGITDEKKALWRKAYPACDLDAELAKAAAWVIENPAKGQKSNWGRFITNWLSRTQDRGGTKGYAPAPSSSMKLTKEQFAAKQREEIARLGGKV